MEPLNELHLFSLQRRLSPFEAVVIVDDQTRVSVIASVVVEGVRRSGNNVGI